MILVEGKDVDMEEFRKAAFEFGIDVVYISRSKYSKDVIRG
jgi:hypothetical protein